MQSKDTKKLVRSYPGYMVDERYIGELCENTQAIVMDCVQDRDKLKPRVKVMRTTNVALLAGHNTVAVFRIKKQEVVVASPEPEVLNSTHLFVAFLNKKSAVATNNGTE